MAAVVYHERQSRPDSCRMHATNACLGRAAYTWPTFLALCHEFSALTGGHTAEYHAGDGVTLFGHALRRAGAAWATLPLAMYKAGTSDNKKTAARLEFARAHALGALVYNAGHVWYLKRHGPGWVKVDSLGGGVSATTLDSVWRDGLGVEVIFPEGCDLESVVGKDDACAVPSPQLFLPPPPRPSPPQLSSPPRPSPPRPSPPRPSPRQSPPRQSPPRQSRSLPSRSLPPRPLPPRPLPSRVAQAPTAQRRNGLGFALRR